ncbi:tonsoku-like protein [Penaeus chinensis]|uniref:tonsoku-like protein n=1 Tax=Penaeus chinensis TaxID=139456 RepID=UPI001FB5921A|nr:tonsoku-like protein [Penaeus chinensis]
MSTRLEPSAPYVYVKIRLYSLVHSQPTLTTCLRSLPALAVHSQLATQRPYSLAFSRSSQPTLSRPPTTYRTAHPPTRPPPRLFLNLGYAPMSTFVLDTSEVVGMIRQGDKIGVLIYLRKGGDPNARNQLGMNLLHVACLEGQEEVVEVLLDAGAKVNSCTTDMCTPLHRACIYGYKGIVELLLSKSAYINAQDGAQDTNVVAPDLLVFRLSSADCPHCYRSSSLAVTPGHRRA